MYLPFEKMPDHSRVWVYQSSRSFTKDEKEFIQKKLSGFCENWNTHGSLMPTSFDIRFDQVIILAVDESQLGASGCSIDSSVRILKEIEEKFGLDLLNQGKVSYLVNKDTLEVNPLFGIKSKVEQGFLLQETIVLNPVVSQKADLNDKWLISAKDSWLNKFFAN